MTGKYGYPYFANFINSDMKPEDARSMALCGNQKLVFKDKNGNVGIDTVENLVHTWLTSGNQGYKMLMDGSFVDVVDMFEVPYEKYDNYVSITLENGYVQEFSEQHKCQVLRNGEIQIVESQDLTSDDCFLISSKPWGINNGIGDYITGKIVGYYLSHGWKDTPSGSSIYFGVDDEAGELASAITHYFSTLGCNVTIEPNYEAYKITVDGTQAVEFVEHFISGDNLIEERLTNNMWNTCDDFRKGVYDGYFCVKEHFPHMTNKDMINDLITVAASIGHVLKYINGQVLKDIGSAIEVMDDKYSKIDDFYVVPIREVELVESNTDTMYNFTVDTDDHLFELPNGIITHQCCRLRLDLTELRKRNGGLFGSGDNTGSIGVVTVNLPRLAYKFKGDKEGFFKELDAILNDAKDSLELKRAWLQENIIDTRAIPAFATYVGTLRNHFSTIGIVGMNEMCENFFGEGIDILTPEGKAFSIEVSNHIREELLKFQAETGNLYNYEATPAESTAFRLARMDKKEFEDIITRGTKKAPYYTNSCHIPVSKVTSIRDTFDHQEDLQALFTGGTVIHIWANGAISGDTAKDIIKTVCMNYKVPYISISPLNRYCPEHGYIADKVDTCPVCGTPLQMYQRITGYLRCIDNYNDGKKEEFKERNQLNLED